MLPQSLTSNRSVGGVSVIGVPNTWIPNLVILILIATVFEVTKKIMLTTHQTPTIVANADAYFIQLV